MSRLTTTNEFQLQAPTLRYLRGPIHIHTSPATLNGFRLLLSVLVCLLLLPVRLDPPPPVFSRSSSTFAFQFQGRVELN